MSQEHQSAGTVGVRGVLGGGHGFPLGRLCQ